MKLIKLMKRLSLYLFLVLFILQTSSWADDIRDFEIEGMSIGDSALDYFSEEAIKNNMQLDYYKHIKNKKFYLSEFHNFPFFKTYVGLQLDFKLNDKKYKIYAISGGVFYDENINDCYKKLDEIAEEFSGMFKNAERNDFKFLKISEDKDEGTYSGVTFYLKSGIASVHCYDWLEKMSYTDNLRINLKTQKYEDWLRTD